MSEAIKPTPGPWRVSQDDVVVRVAAKSAILYEQFLPEYGDDDFRREQKEACANAALITEAGTVHHETGLTPRQLVEQRDALAEVLQKLASAFMSHTRWNGDPPAEVAEARAALALVKGEKP